MKKPLLVIFFVLVCDQALKFWVKLNFALGSSRNVIGDWFQLNFIENPGFAFGMQMGDGSFAKIALTIFRLLAIIALFWWMVSLVKKKTKTGPLIGIALITAGALGNLCDSMFYGLIFSGGVYGEVATWGSYAGLMQGKVVDMLYFPIIDIAKENAPRWIPKLMFGYDNHFIFFRPVFNIADAAVTTGVFYMLLFQMKFLKKL